MFSSKDLGQRLSVMFQPKRLQRKWIVDFSLCNKFMGSLCFPVYEFCVTRDSKRCSVGDWILVIFINSLNVGSIARSGEATTNLNAPITHPFVKSICHLLVAINQQKRSFTQAFTCFGTCKRWKSNPINNSRLHNIVILTIQFKHVRSWRRVGRFGLYGLILTTLAILGAKTLKFRRFKVQETQKNSFFWSFKGGNVFKKYKFGLIMTKSPRLGRIWREKLKFGRLLD